MECIKRVTFYTPGKEECVHHLPCTCAGFSSSSSPQPASVLPYMLVS